MNACFRTEELKWGSVVGEDKYGNKYYHNKLYAIGAFSCLLVQNQIAAYF